MKRIIFFISILGLNLLPALQAISQQADKHYLHAGFNGIYAGVFQSAIDNHVNLNNISLAEIQTRSSANEKWKRGVKFTIPSIPEQFIKNYRNIESSFPDYGSRNDAALIKVWNLYKKYISNDSLQVRLFSFSIPIKLALGITLQMPVSQSGKYICRVVAYDNNKNVLVTSNEEMVTYPANVHTATLIYHQKKILANGMKLSWKVTENKYAGSYFTLFHQTTGKGKFTKVDFTRWINYRKEGAFVEFTDTLLQNAPYAKFYVVSYDAWFNKGFVSDTVIVSINNRQTFPMPQNFTVKTDDHTGIVKLSWHLSDPTVVRNVNIYRGQYFNQPFTRIASVDSKTTTYEDKNVKAGNKYYYFLQSTGFLNEKSLPTVKIYAYSKSDEKPFKPVNIIGKSIKGGVLLQWPHGNDFIKGYFVYRNNGYTDSLVEVSGFIPNTDTTLQFADTGKLLSPKWFYAYAIKSVSQNNVESDFSDTLKIRPSIKMPPPEPYGLEVLKKNDNVWIAWQNMLAHNNSVLGYKLRRVHIAESDTIILNKLISNQTNYFIDTTADITETYAYGLQTISVTEDISPIRWITYHGQLARPPAPLYPTILKDSDSLEITWSPVFDTGVKGYKVYGYKRGHKPMLAGTTKTDKTRLKISAPSPGLWFYYIESYNKKYASPHSDEVFIRIK